MYVTVVDKDLDELCRRAGISRRRLAKEAGINYISLCKASAGKHRLTEETWNKLASVLDEYIK